MALVNVSVCATCKALQGDRHRVTTPIPTDDIMNFWKSSGFCEATDGCPCEVDGVCIHGHHSWLVSLGKVKRNPLARPKKFRQPIPKPGRLGNGKIQGRQGEKEMAKTKVAAAGKRTTTRVGGFRQNTSGALLYTLLSDGKTHSKAELLKVVTKGGVQASSFMGRMMRFRREGKDSGRFTLTHLEDGRWKMSGGRAPAKAKAVAKSKPVAKAVAKPSVSDDAE